MAENTRGVIENTLGPESERLLQYLLILYAVSSFHAPPNDPVKFATVHYHQSFKLTCDLTTGQGSMFELRSSS